MEDNIYKIQENINRIFIEIEENAGEITEEQLEQLNINQENLKQKLSDYNKAIQVYKNYNEGISNEIKRYEFIEYCRELYKNDLLITGDDIDIQGLIDAINAKCIAERGEAFAPFTIYDFICVNIIFKFTVSLKNLIESNNYLLQAYYGLDYSTGIDMDIDKNTVKYIVKDQNTNNNITIGNIEKNKVLCMK